MKKYFVSTLATIALALPLGIGGVILTAPVTSTDADAQSAIQHWFDTCGQDTIARCHPDHQTYIWTNGDNFGYKSGRGNLPYASDGADHKAYDYLKDRIDSGTLTAIQQEFWQAAFDRFFPDGVKPPIPPYINVRQYLNDVHRELQGFKEGDTPEERLESFQNDCEEAGGVNTMRFSFGLLDFSANQCRVEAVEDPANVDEDTTIETFFASFNPAADPADPLARFEDHLPTPFLFQVTAIEGFTTDNPNPFSGDEGTVISQHRDSIIELQEEVTTHDEAIATITAMQSMIRSDVRSNTGTIATLTSDVEDNAGTITGLVEDVETNTTAIQANTTAVQTNTTAIEANTSALSDVGTDMRANTSAIAELGKGVDQAMQGVALSLALDTPSLSAGDKFGLYGGFGHFEGFQGLAVSTVFRLADDWQLSGGLGTTELTEDDGVFAAKAGVFWKF